MTRSKPRPGTNITAALPVETVSLTDLMPHPDNYRDHPEDQISQIKASIRGSGFYRNIVIARDGTILAGHGVALAAEQMGLNEVPVVRLDIAPDSPAAMRVLISDNEIGKGADSDDRALTELLRDLANDDDGLLGTGYTEEQLLSLIYITRHDDEIGSKEAAAEWVGMPDYDPSTDTPKLIVSFKTDQDQDRFCSEMGIEVDSRKGKTWSTRWPWTDRIDSSSVRFMDA